MPASLTPIPSRPRSEQPSQGGLPPKDRPPRGGGGDGDEGNSGHRNGPREALHRFRSFLAIGILSDEILFLVLAILFFARKGATHLDRLTLHQVSDWTPVYLPPILYLNIVILLLSSLTMERARRHIFREIDVLEEWLGLGQPALTASRRWLAVSAALGIAFLTGQWKAWQQLAVQGNPFGAGSSPAATFVYMMSGLHALHLALGLAALGFCLTGLGFLRRVESRQIAIDAATWFWHAMGATWLVLFALLRFAQ